MSADTNPGGNIAEKVAQQGVWGEVAEWLSGKNRNTPEAEAALVYANLLYSRGIMVLYRDDKTPEKRDEVKDAKALHAWYSAVLKVEKDNPQYAVFENRFKRRLLAVEGAKVDGAQITDPKIRMAHAHINAGNKLGDMVAPRPRAYR